jgi:O-antigen/teichoic acid export membrane protein
MSVEVTLGQVMRIIIASAALSLLVALTMLVRRVKRLGPPEPLASTEVLRITLPLWINGFMAYAMTQSDVLILGGFRSTEEVAIYGAAARLVSLVLMSLMLVNLVVPPFIAELFARGEKRRLERMLRLTATLAGLPAVGILLVYLLFGPWILGAVYQEAYAAGATVLALLSIGRLVHVAVGSAAFALSMTGYHTALMRITLVAGVGTIVAELLLVRPFGSIGVAAAICGGVILQSLWVWLAARYYCGVWTHVALPRWREFRDLLRI